MVDQEKQATPKRELVIYFNWYSHISSLMQAQWGKDEASQPQLKIVHLIISGSQIIWVKNRFIYDDWSSPSL
jgi:hypothetical protein